MTVPNRLLGATLLAPLALFASAQAANFTILQEPFVQSIYGVAEVPGENNFLGGIAFAPDGDLWVAACLSNNGVLFRFDAQRTIERNATTLHPLLGTVTTNTGCGLTNHPDGSLYSNTTEGVTRQNATTGEAIGSAFGAPGNGLGITVNPATNEIVYVGADGTIHAIDANFSTQRVFSSAYQGSLIDGIYFDPTGEFLFLAVRTPSFQLGIVRADSGDPVQSVALTSEPDGIAFRAEPPNFVVTVNLDGTMTRVDFANDDFTQTPTTSRFAAGGARGDLSQVGTDGCLYLTQSATRFDDNTESADDSVIQICPGFAPPSSLFSDDFEANR